MGEFLAGAAVVLFVWLVVNLMKKDSNKPRTGTGGGTLPSDGGDVHKK
jgi:hypothetical protein